MKEFKAYVTASSEETKKIGQEFSKNLKPGDIVALFGELGSGKTTFVQGLAKGLGIKKRIISPTFVIVRAYKSPKGDFFHSDLYRIEENFKNLSDIGIYEILKEKNGIVVIEWAEKIVDLLPEKKWEIFFEHKDNYRKITIKNGK
jgi:tRNA threonylcarbamoyladenosine biosynthesis protein TsaE